MKEFSQLTIPNFTGMGSRSSEEYNGAPYTLALVMKNPNTGLCVEANYVLKLSSCEALIRWSLKWFGWPKGYVAPQHFVVQSCGQASEGSHEVN